jgi:hypothetical protein
MTEQIIKTPVQIFVNDKFFITVEEVQIKRASAEFKKIHPNAGPGTVINLVKTKPETKPETDERLKEIQQKDYDEWFHRLVNIKGDPTLHQPI